MFTVRIDNLTGTTANAGGHSSRGGARAVDLTEFTLTSLVDSDFGDLNGKGDCAVPQVIPTGGFYSCSFTEVVSGTAPGTHLNKVTAKGTFPGAPPVTASAEATAVVEIVEPVPALASWGQAALLLTLAGIGIFLVSRRRVAR